MSSICTWIRKSYSWLCKEVFEKEHPWVHSLPTPASVVKQLLVSPSEWSLCREMFCPSPALASPSPTSNPQCPVRIEHKRPCAFSFLTCSLFLYSFSNPSVLLWFLRFVLITSLLLLLHVWAFSRFSIICTPALLFCSLTLTPILFSILNPFVLCANSWIYPKHTTKGQIARFPWSPWCPVC